MMPKLTWETDHVKLEEKWRLISKKIVHPGKRLVIFILGNQAYLSILNAL